MTGLYDALRERRQPVRVALVGCGKFGTMFLAQARRLPGLEVTVAVDLDVDRARAAFRRASWPDGDVPRLVTTLDAALDDSVDVVVEATGNARAGVRHALAAIDAGAHVVLVTVEADALVGVELARRAAENGVCCTMAYGDQPALICELVDWARACGFEVVCAGKGSKYLPSYHELTPETVWKHYGFSSEEVATGDYNAKMFTSFNGRDEVGDRDVRGRQRDRAAASGRWARIPGRGRRRPGLGLPAEHGRRRARPGADRRGRLVARPLRRAGPGRPALGRLRHVHRRRRLHPPLPRRVRRAARRRRPLRLAVPAEPLHRARAGGQRPRGRAARRADGSDEGVHGRRRRGRQARPAAGRPARRRGRPNGLGAARAGGDVGRRGPDPDRPRRRAHRRPPGRGRRGRRVGRCRRAVGGRRRARAAAPDRAGGGNPRRCAITRIGFIGLGVMGGPMAGRLLDAGFDLVVLTRTRARAEALLDRGARWADSPAAVARDADVVITMLPDTADVDEVAGDGLLAGLARDAIWVDMSTIAPAAWRRLAAAAAERGVAAVDAPVSGGEPGARDGTLVIMAGGDEAALARLEPVFGVLGTVRHIGGPGAGQVAKACNQIVTGGTIALVAEALTLARKAAVDPGRVREALLGGFASSRILDAHGARMLAGDFAPGFQARLHRKDLSIVLDEARALDAAAPLTAAAAQLFNALVARGDGDLDSIALLRLYAELAGVEAAA